MRWWLLIAVVGLLVAAVPAHAGDGSVSRVGTTIVVTFAAGESRDTLIINASGGSGGSILLDEDTPSPTTFLTPVPGSNCTVVNGDDVTCQVAGATRLLVEFGGGQDFSEVFQFAVPMTLELHGGAGNDFQMWGSERDDIIDGGPGDDELDGFFGDDTLTGGAGDDHLEGGAETDDISGGTGFDTVDFAGLGALGVFVTLDDLPGDGAPGQLDNIHSDVEDIDGTGENDVITGGPGNNIIFGGGGGDQLDGAGGADIINGGDDNDAITSRDGLAELIDCGDGIDSVVADDIDVTDGCESEQRSSLLQTDVDGDGASRPADCDDRNAAIRPGATDILDDGIDQNCDGADATDPDRDRDGVPRPIDCDDGNPAARPGARERRGNRVDENCNGRAEPFAVVTNGVPNAWITQGASTRNVRLGVRDVRKGMRIELRCRGGGCPFAKKVRKVRKRSRLLNLHPLLAGAVLRPGAVLELRIKRREAIGKVVRYSVRNGAVPNSRALCLPPGKKKAREC
jgi:Putative metal-binding motif/RTX calcium-binding nonapeptide repeat (4 copies)